jgi:hypothetical protein
VATDPLDPALLRAALSEQAAALPAAGALPDAAAEASALASALADLVLLADQAGVVVPAARRRAVRAAAATLAARAPGRSVEVRVPPDVAIQCVPGPRHTRGTPPAVIETDPITFLQVAVGRRSWADAVGSGRVRASGQRTDLSAWLPLLG